MGVSRVNTNADIATYKEFVSFIAALHHVNDTVWTNPIANGKWSISEIVSHIKNWDRYLLAETLPAVRKGEDIEFPDFDTYNQIASDYVKSGIMHAELIKETILTREQLVMELFEMPVDALHRHVTVNGASHCPHTGTPYSLAYIIKEFIEHDNLHKQQIVEFLSESKSTTK